MDHTPPSRGRPKLQLRLTTTPSSPFLHRSNSSAGTPLGTTTYSPFRSASLKAPTAHKGDMRFVPKRTGGQYVYRMLQQARRLLLSRLLWIVLALSMLVLWWWMGEGHDLRVPVFGPAEFGHGLHYPRVASSMHFFPASNPKIHVSCVLPFLKILKLMTLA